MTIGGHEVQLTLRGTSEEEVLARLTTILRQYPVLPSPGPRKAIKTSSETSDTSATADAPESPTHGAMKKSTKGKGWYCPHRMADDTWCPSKDK
jgi:hypothetical protein